MEGCKNLLKPIEYCSCSVKQIRLHGSVVGPIPHVNGSRRGGLPTGLSELIVFLDSWFERCILGRFINDRGQIAAEISDGGIK